MLKNNQIIQGDCLEVMKQIPDKSIDMILCDLPYGTTACKWDIVIPFDKLWAEYKRLIKPNGAIVLFGSQPFTTDLIISNREWFKYELIWDKVQTGAPGVAYMRPLPCHENMLVFSPSSTTYNPIMSEGTPYRSTTNCGGNSHGFGFKGKHYVSVNDGVRFPLSIVRQAKERHVAHTTQKPVDLLRYLVRTYTNPGETVLDFTMGSGTTGVACAMEGRHFIGVELDAGYFDIAKRRIEQVQPALMEAAS